MDMVEKQIERRRQRGETDIKRIVNRGRHPVYSTFEVTSYSGRTYRVRIRDLERRRNTCTCPDYRTNLIGTCKHIEGVLAQLTGKLGDELEQLAADRPTVTYIYVRYARDVTVRVDRPEQPEQLSPTLRRVLHRYFDAEGVLLGDVSRTLPSLLREIEGLPEGERATVEVGDHVKAHLELLRDRASVAEQKEWFEEEVREGNRSLSVLSVPLYPYQEAGAMHLAFGRRAMLADDMGLGKTVQAIAAVVLLRQLRDIQRVLVVCPASIKHQWAREVSRFTDLGTQIIGGPPEKRREQYENPAVFNMVNYELVLRDVARIRRLEPDVIILDEAQRIKNWRTKTADAVKRLESPYGFVLTGTPLENRLDELYSIFQFLDARILGPLWKFNERYFEVEQRSKSSYRVLGYKNLDELRRRIGPYVERRTREEVLDDLPARTDNNYFVEMTDAQWRAYEEFQMTAARLLSIAQRRPLSPKEHKILLGALVKMRLICNALALHDRTLDERQRERTSPKLRELRSILDDELSGNSRKALVFSQWTSMLEMAKPVLERIGLGYVMLSGDVPTHKRGRLIEINLDLPWNPAVLEQRIARAHRHGQPHTVQVVNLIAQKTIEERMLDTLAAKRSVFEGVFGDDEAPGEIKFADTGQALMKTLDELLGQPKERETELLLEPSAEEEDTPVAVPVVVPVAVPVPAPARPTLEAFADLLVARFPGRVLLVRRAPQLADVADGPGVLVVVDREPTRLRPEIEALVGGHWPDAPPELYLMEREGYRMLAAMMGGVQPAEPDDEPYRAPALPKADPAEARRKRLRQAEDGLDTAGKRLRLAEVVLESGFPEDFAVPLREALGWGLSSLMALVEVDTAHLRRERNPSAEPPPVREVQSVLVDGDHLPADLAARLSHARELTAPSEGDEEPAPLSASAAEALVASVRDLIALGRQRAVEQAVG
jgi:hypothetical protein